MRPFARAFSWILVLASAACGGGGAKEANAPQAEPASAADSTDARAAEADAGAPGSGSERPFAKSAAEATELITSAVDQHQDEVAKCVQQYRFRKHLAHEKVSVNIGIDQEGRLIGVTLPKGKEDKELSACVQGVLQDARFPRSRAGVITITRTFQEMVQ